MSIARERCRASSAQFTVTRWHGDTSFSTFRLARGQAGTFGLIFPACPRESKSSEITVTSVTPSPRSRLLRIQNSKTYDTKVSHLRYKSQGLTLRNPLVYKHQNKENLWESMSNHEQVWATVNCPLTISVSLQRDSEIPGALYQQNRQRPLMEQALQYAMQSQSASCPPLQQAIVRRLHPLSSGKREAWWERWSLL